MIRKGIKSDLEAKVVKEKLKRNCNPLWRVKIQDQLEHTSIPKEWVLAKCQSSQRISKSKNRIISFSVQYSIWHNQILRGSGRLYIFSATTPSPPPLYKVPPSLDIQCWYSLANKYYNRKAEFWRSSLVQISFHQSLPSPILMFRERFAHPALLLLLLPLPSIGLLSQLSQLQYPAGKNTSVVSFLGRRMNERSKTTKKEYKTINIT